VEVYLLCLTLTDSRDESTTIIRLSKQVWCRPVLPYICILGYRLCAIIVLTCFVHFSYGLLMFQASIGQLYEMVCAGKGVAKEKVSSRSFSFLLHLMP